MAAPYLPLIIGFEHDVHHLPFALESIADLKKMGIRHIGIEADINFKRISNAIAAVAEEKETSAEAKMHLLEIKRKIETGKLPQFFEQIRKEARKNGMEVTNIDSTGLIEVLERRVWRGIRDSGDLSRIVGYNQDKLLQYTESRTNATMEEYPELYILANLRNRKMTIRSKSAQPQAIFTGIAHAMHLAEEFRVPSSHLFFVSHNTIVGMPKTERQRQIRRFWLEQYPRMKEKWKAMHEQRKQHKLRPRARRKP